MGNSKTSTIPIQKQKRSDLGGVPEEKRMTEPLRWPNSAAGARDQAAEEAQAVIHALAPLVGDVPVGDKEEMRRIAVALMKAERIARILESVGAKTKPY